MYLFKLGSYFFKRRTLVQRQASSPKFSKSKNRLSGGLSQVFLILTQMSVNLVNHLGVGVAYQLGNRVYIDAALNTVRDVGMPIGVRRN